MYLLLTADVFVNFLSFCELLTVLSEIFILLRLLSFTALQSRRFQIIVSNADAMWSISPLAKTMPRGFVAPLRDRLANRGYVAALASRFNSKYPATSSASASDAVLSSSLIAVLRMRGLMSVGTGLRS